MQEEQNQARVEKLERIIKELNGEVKKVGNEKQAMNVQYSAKMQGVLREKEESQVNVSKLEDKVQKLELEREQHMLKYKQHVAKYNELEAKNQAVVQEASELKEQLKINQNNYDSDKKDSEAHFAQKQNEMQSKIETIMAQMQA